MTLLHKRVLKNNVINSGFLSKLGSNYSVVLDMPFHICDALFDVFLLVDVNFILLIELVFEPRDIAGHIIKVGFNFMEGLFVGGNMRTAF
eukprot:15327292-Ditylum_brightwellii.AAC.1